MATAPHVIDLRSDTLTQPTAEMRKAMAEAPALKALADEAGKALEARAAGLNDRQKAADAAIKQAVAGLGGKR